MSTKEKNRNKSHSSYQEKRLSLSFQEKTNFRLRIMLQQYIFNQNIESSILVFSIIKFLKELTTQLITN